MSIHLVSASRLSEQLASKGVSEREQAFYLSASFILWLLPGYFLVVPAPNVFAWSLPFGLWFYELVMLILIYTFGVFYCLGKCRAEPRKNFLIDFSCLYAPVSLTTLVVVWGLFHIYASLIPWWLQKQTFDSSPRWLELIYSARFLDLMRFFAIVAINFLVVIRVGNHMARVSNLRLIDYGTANDAARAESL
jgi:hypothetical protein